MNYWTCHCSACLLRPLELLSSRVISSHHLFYCCYVKVTKLSLMLSCHHNVVVVRSTEEISVLLSDIIMCLQ